VEVAARPASSPLTAPCEPEPPVSMPEPSLYQQPAPDPAAAFAETRNTPPGGRESAFAEKLRQAWRKEP